MELVKIENSQIISLFVTTRAQGQHSLPQIIKAFVERYEFAVFPIKIDELEDRVFFRQGTFKGVGLESVDLYQDGLSVKAQSPTSLLDEFMVDVNTWMDSYLGLKRVETHAVSKNYESHIVFRSEAHVFQPLEVLSQLQAQIAKAMESATGLSAVFQPIALGFSPDNVLIPGMKPIPFRVERRAAVAFDSNLYFSSAPLTTNDHIAALEKLEQLVSR